MRGLKLRTFLWRRRRRLHGLRSSRYGLWRGFGRRSDGLSSFRYRCHGCYRCRLRWRFDDWRWPGFRGFDYGRGSPSTRCWRWLRLGRCLYDDRRRSFLRRLRHRLRHGLRRCSNDFGLVHHVRSTTTANRGSGFGFGRRGFYRSGRAATTSGSGGRCGRGRPGALLTLPARTNSRDLIVG